MATIENLLADPVSLSGRQRTSSVLLNGLFVCFEIVFISSVAVAIALSI